jgi:high frequency lysogenization protein
MRYNDEDRALALAGVFQAVAATAALARDGRAPPRAFAASLRSVLRQDAPDVPSVFGGIGELEFGLETLLAQLTSPSGRDLETTRYLVSVFQLENRLRRDRDRLDRLGADLAALASRAEDEDLGELATSQALAEIYQRHISTLAPRIMVKGEPLYLQNPDVAARIRTTLLAAIRAVHLWRQCGGSRWQLVLRRGRLLGAARGLLAAVREEADRAPS